MEKKIEPPFPLDTEEEWQTNHEHLVLNSRETKARIGNLIAELQTLLPPQVIIVLERDSTSMMVGEHDGEFDIESNNPEIVGARIFGAFDLVCMCQKD